MTVTGVSRPYAFRYIDSNCLFDKKRQAKTAAEGFFHPSAIGYVALQLTCLTIREEQGLQLRKISRRYAIGYELLNHVSG